MFRIQVCLLAASLAGAALAVPTTASARGPIRQMMARPVLRAPTAAVRTIRMVAPPYGRFYYPARDYGAPVRYVQETAW